MNNVTYGSEDITSLSFDSGSISGETYQIGSTYMNSIQLVFPSIIETVKEDLEVIPELAVLVNGNYEYTKLGHFFIDEFERNRNSNTTTIKATDKMRFMEGPYESKLSYKKPYREVALEVANLAGVEINESSFSALGTAAINKPEGYTFRQAIGLIAQFEGGFASFNRNGELEIRRLAPTNFEITPESYMLKGFTKNEVSYRIGGITVKTGEEETDVIRVGSTNGSQVQLENKVMTQQLLNQIWELVKNLNYFPYELKWRGCPPLEAGDWIYITANDGTKYSVPNLSYSITFNGGMSAESKATTSSSSQATYKYRGPLNQRVDYLDSILSSNNWNSNYYDTTEPRNPKEGDIWFKPNGQDTEIWIYRNVDGVLKWVMEITSAGDPELLAAIEDAKQAGQDAETAAKEAKEEAESAKQAGENAANLAIQAGLDAQAAKDKADAIKIDVNGLVSDVATINGTVSSISSKANQAYDKANAVEGRTATLETSVTGLTGRLTDVESTATSTTKKLNELVVTVDGQKQTLATVTTTAESALNKANVLETTVDGVSRTISSVQTDMATKITDQSYATSSSADANIRKWTLIAKTKLTARYQDIRVGIDFIGSGAGNSKTTLGRIFLNHKQQAIMGQNSLFEISISDTSLVTASDLVAIEVTTSESLSEVWYYMKWSQTYTAFRMTPFNKAGSGTIEYMATQPFMTELPPYNAIQYGVERGSLASNTETITKVNQVSETVDGHTQLIATTKTTADSALTKATQVESTANGLKTTISSVETTANTALTKATQVEATASGLTSSVGDIQTDIIDLTNRFSDFNFKKQTPKPTLEGANITASYDANGLVLSNPATSGSQRAYWSLPNIVIGKTYNIKIYANVGASAVNREIEVGFSGGENVKFSYPNTTAAWISGTAKANGNGVALSFWIPNGVALRLRELYVYEANTNITSSQITQLSDIINLKVSKNDVVNQINISTDGVLISGNKVQITGQTYIENAVIKTAHIADLAVSNGKIANLSVTEGKIGDAAITNAKIGNLAVSTAKIADGAIVNAKIGDAAITNAKIADATISSAKIINLDASKIVANSLAAITTETGTLNVTGWLTMATENRGMMGTYDFGDGYAAAFNYRWFVGDWRLSHRHLVFTGKIYNVTSSNTRGSYLYDAESFYGNDYLKMRQYNSSGKLLNRIDINSDAITMSNEDWGGASQSIIRSDGTSYFNGRGSFAGLDVSAPNNVGLRTHRIDAPTGIDSFKINDNRAITDVNFGISNIYFNETKTSAADLRIGLDGVGKTIASLAVYNRTYSSAANVTITSSGTLGRSTSASKYKLNISEIMDAEDLGLKLLTVIPKYWFDKSNSELAARDMTEGELCDIDPITLNPHYGLIAEDLRGAGLDAFISTNYETGEIEGIEYDRLWVTLIPLLRKLVESDVLKDVRLNKIERLMEGILNG
jgi:hypothetical protein